MIFMRCGSIRGWSIRALISKIPASSLDQAQLRKLDLICRKLDLRPGERLLDIGCGWGGLLIHAATHYGVNADGVTLSENQLEWTRRLIEENRLQDRVTVRLADYREMKREEIYDKAVSVGMVEHVGRNKARGLFSAGWADFEARAACF